MAFGDALKKFWFRDDYDEEAYEEEAESAPASESHYDGYDSYSVKQPAAAGKVMSLREKSSVSLKIHRFKGTQWQEIARKAAGDFKNGCAVLLSTEEANKDATTRLLDFLGGVVYALDGKIAKFSTTGYAIVPFNCEITGEIYEDLNCQMEDMFS